MSSSTGLRQSDFATTAERSKRRAEILRNAIARAQQHALVQARSSRCSGYGGLFTARHAGMEDGCVNNGSSCICECHDPSE